MSSFTSFNLSGLEVMQHLILPLVVIFTIANAIVPALAEGGSKYKIFSNLGITAAISGVALLILPVLASQLFVSVSQF
jgi:archaellum biogenesis protein FlaJ (TadC family)